MRDEDKTKKQLITELAEMRQRIAELEKLDVERKRVEDITERKRAEEELKNSREQLRDLSLYLQSVREEERKRIAREIHDELGQALTALKIDLSWLEKRLPSGQKSLLEKIESMSKLIDMTIQTVRRISSELRPRILDDFGIAAAIEWQVEEFQNRTGIKCEVTLKVSLGRKYVSSSLAEKLAFDLEIEEKPLHETLADREYQVMCMIALGKTVSEIAEELSLSVKTISTYRSRALEKMAMRNNAELTHYAIKNLLVN